MLMERDEIVYWHRLYLKEVGRHRNMGRTIYYLVETWVNAGHSTCKAWIDLTVKSSRDAFLRGLSCGLRDPSGKGGRLTFVHIGSNKGFVPNGLFAMESKKTGNYHKDMDSTVFEDWIQSVLPELEPNSVIVLDITPVN